LDVHFSPCGISLFFGLVFFGLLKTSARVPRTTGRLDCQFVASRSIARGWADHHCEALPKRSHTVPGQARQSPLLLTRAAGTVWERLGMKVIG
jgi:hypothetical protein